MFITLQERTQDGDFTYIWSDYCDLTPEGIGLIMYACK